MRKFIFIGLLALSAIMYANTYATSEPEKVNVNEYEEARNYLYDSALNLLEDIKKADLNDWMQVHPEYRESIEKCRVPSLNVLLEAIHQIEDGIGEDVFFEKYEEITYDYDEAFYKYQKLIE